MIRNAGKRVFVVSCIPGFLIIIIEQKKQDKLSYLASFRIHPFKPARLQALLLKLAGYLKSSGHGSRSRYGVIWPISLEAKQLHPHPISFHSG
jgi:hypothetical protein